jgi:hypothetical protein
MDDKELAEQIRDTIIAEQFPELLGVEPEIEFGHSESKLRALRRLRGYVTDEDRATIPKEYTLTYFRPADDQQPFDRAIVVVTDEAGNAQYIMESK